MKNLDAPFQELCFYFGARPESEALEQLVAALVTLGARFAGEARVHCGPGLRDQPFAFITDLIQESVVVKNLTDMRRLLKMPNLRVVQVDLDGATGTLEDVAEVVTYLDISPAAVGMDRHPLAIWTEGWLFSGPIRIDEAVAAKAVGMRLYERFRTLIGMLRPAYAAITHESPLECPADLRRDPRTLSFYDFYVSRTYLGRGNTERVKELFIDAYIEELDEGIYVSTWPEFNPAGIEVDVRLLEPRAKEVATMIGSVGGLS